MAKLVSDYTELQKQFLNVSEDKSYLVKELKEIKTKFQSDHKIVLAQKQKSYIKQLLLKTQQQDERVKILENAIDAK